MFVEPAIEYEVVERAVMRSLLSNAPESVHIYKEVAREVMRSLEIVHTTGEMNG